jgi:adenosylcobinamide-phosphate synthase
MLSLPTLMLMVLAACALDRLLVEPSRFHPLVGFGHLASRLEKRFNISKTSATNLQRYGLLCWAALVVLPALTVTLLLPLLDTWLQILLGTIILYLVIGGRSLQEHATRVYQDLHAGRLQDARTHVSWLVSRDTRQLDETGISKACIESVLENGNDALFAPIFWFCLLGPAGAILYRFANTLDAMWGYRTPRYINFGRAAARLDDVLNYLPARLTALAYCLAGNTAQAFQCWRVQAPDWDSPNAGPVMAAGAGALNLELGGAAEYHGATESRPHLGHGQPPSPEGIGLAQQLLRRALWIWLGALIICALLTLFF